MSDFDELDPFIAGLRHKAALRDAAAHEPKPQSPTASEIAAAEAEQKAREEFARQRETAELKHQEMKQRAQALLNIAKKVAEEIQKTRPNLSPKGRRLGSGEFYNRKLTVHEEGTTTWSVSDETYSSSVSVVEVPIRYWRGMVLGTDGSVLEVEEYDDKTPYEELMRRYEGKEPPYLRGAGIVYKPGQKPYMATGVLTAEAMTPNSGDLLMLEITPASMASEFSDTHNAVNGRLEKADRLQAGLEQFIVDNHLEGLFLETAEPSPDQS